MQCVTAVDGYWLAELGPMFYTVKESTKTRLVSGNSEVKDVLSITFTSNAKREFGSSFLVSSRLACL